MPLYPNAKDLIRVQIERLARNERVGIIEIGRLTDYQHTRICELRVALGFPALEQPVLVYKGAHHFDSRVRRDGYAFEDLILQIEAATSEDAVVELQKYMTTLASPILRADGYGCLVGDRATLELTARKPRAELFSVIPKGDMGGPKKRQGH